MIVKNKYEDVEQWREIMSKLSKISTIGNSEIVGMLNEIDMLQRNLILT
jgi:hypothetical protein